MECKTPPSVRTAALLMAAAWMLHRKATTVATSSVVAIRLSNEVSLRDYLRINIHRFLGLFLPGRRQKIIDAICTWPRTFLQQLYEV